MKLTNVELPLYIEKPGKRWASVYLSEEAYAEATRCLVLVCVDVLIINKRTKTFYLARRKSRPAKDWWWFIGGRRKFGERPLEGIKHCFERETGLRISRDRFCLVDINEYFFRDRQQKTQNMGTHSLAHTFYVDLSMKELSMIQLDVDEYHGSGLREFTQESLRKLPLRQPVKDIVHKVFP